MCPQRKKKKKKKKRLRKRFWGKMSTKWSLETERQSSLPLSAFCCVQGNFSLLIFLNKYENVKIPLRFLSKIKKNQCNPKYSNEFFFVTFF